MNFLVVWLGSPRIWIINSAYPTHWSKRSWFMDTSYCFTWPSCRESTQTMQAHLCTQHSSTITRHFSSKKNKSD
jgi:hypothetical protein